MKFAWKPQHKVDLLKKIYIYVYECDLKLDKRNNAIDQLPYNRRQKHIANKINLHAHRYTFILHKWDKKVLNLNQSMENIDSEIEAVFLSNFVYRWRNDDWNLQEQNACTMSISITDSPIMHLYSITYLYPN